MDSQGKQLWIYAQDVCVNSRNGVRSMGNKLTGRGGKYNFPAAQMKLIEQDDEKRAFMAKCIENNLAFFNMGLSPVKTDEELAERLNFFFTTCAETQQLPTVEKMANCLGYHRSTLSDWELGKTGGLGDYTKDIIKKAKQILASMDAELAAEGKIQPVVYMFRSKNFYGMADTQEVVLTPNGQRLSEGDYQDLAERYKQLPTIDGEE